MGDGVEGNVPSGQGVWKRGQSLPWQKKSSRDGGDTWVREPRYWGRGTGTSMGEGQQLAAKDR